MKYFPITIIDNFFYVPDKVRDFALSCEYEPSPTGDWPGKRSAPLHMLDKFFFENFCSKLLSIFYDINFHNVQMECRAYFQKITSLDINPKSKKNKGWVHIDDEIFAGIIYLNPEINYDSGTSIYQTNSKYEINKLQNLAKAKHDFYSKNDDTDYDKSFTKFNSCFDETITVKNVYNRLLLIDGQSWHAAQNLYNNDDSRLTLVFFVDKIETTGSTPLHRIKQIDI